MLTVGGPAFAGLTPTAPTRPTATSAATKVVAASKPAHYSEHAAQPAPKPEWQNLVLFGVGLSIAVTAARRRFRRG
ncbi:MAG: hypothetical protein R2752_22935 [Vicinamibacterales bacterium]